MGFFPIMGMVTMILIFLVREAYIHVGFVTLIHMLYLIYEIGCYGCC